MNTTPDLSKLTRREAFGFWLNDQGFIGSGAEIGCAYGAYSTILLGQWKGRTLYMVDPWITQPVDVYRERQHDNYEGWYQECLALQKRDPRVVLIRDFSVEGAKLVNDGALDFVYIDGNHAYRNVMEDLDAWLPKVKVGGIISGHDCYNDTNYPHFSEVERAVRRWMGEHDYSYTVTPCSSFWCVKNHA